MSARNSVLNLPDRLPVWAWRFALALALGAALLTFGLLAATLLGAADPRPLGTRWVEDTFGIPSHWHLSADGEQIAVPPAKNGRLELSVSAAGGNISGTFEEPIDCPCTIELRAEQLGGARDVRYGLWWGDAASRSVILAGINSDGYMGIEPGPLTPGSAIMEWQLFPHVRSSGQMNDFRVDIDAHQISIRLNDEVASRFLRDGSGPISAGLFVQASPHEAAVITFFDFRVWETRSTSP